MLDLGRTFLQSLERSPAAVAVEQALERRLLHRRLQQAHVSPAGLRDARPGEREHLRAHLDADHLAAGADPLHQARERQPGAARDIQHALARAQREEPDAALANALRAPRARVVAGRVPAVLLDDAPRVGIAQHGA